MSIYWLFRRRLSVFLFIIGSLLGVTAVVAWHQSDQSHIIQVEAAESGTYQAFLPHLQHGDPLLCRFGINVIENFNNLQMDLLPVGWYVDYTASNSARPQGATYMPTVRLTQTGPNATDYTYMPSGSALQASIAANPGADWLIGNEPDRREHQDDIEPHIYAAAYHELYTLIKTADPTARIFAGTIVQPSPIRLQYLDMILASYEQQNSGAAMPVDGWSIHNFLLNEVSCEHDPGNCWGAEIPPGIDAPFGEILSVEDNDNLDIFTERIVAFRQWMADRGYGGLPVTLSEYGVLMPEWLGFSEERVNAYMNATFAYLLTTTDPVWGDPYDGYRLVQTWSWYSTGHPVDEFNGYLFEGAPPRPLSTMGQNYASYMAQVAVESDLYPAVMTATLSAGTATTVTLAATIANSGNHVGPAAPVTVQFYDGNPAAGGVQIGSTPSVALAGCGEHQIVEVVWPDVAPGTYQIYVVVDARNAVVESDEQNNTSTLQLVVDMP